MRFHSSVAIGQKTDEIKSFSGTMHKNKVSNVSMYEYVCVHDVSSVGMCVVYVCVCVCVSMCV